MNKEFGTKFEFKEQEPELKSSFTIIVSRHGEKNKGGELTEEGKIKAKELGKNLPIIDQMVIGSFHSDIKRTSDTAQAIVEGIKEKAVEMGKQITIKPLKNLSGRLKWNQKSEEILDEINKEFDKISNTKSFTESIEWWLKESKDAPNIEVWTRAFARALNTFLFFGNKLKDKSNLMLNLVMHGGAPDNFVIKLLKQKGAIPTDATLKDIGGAFGYLDNFVIQGKNFTNGQQKMKFYFRDYQIDISKSDLEQLISSLPKSKKE